MEDEIVKKEKLEAMKRFRIARATRKAMAVAIVSLPFVYPWVPSCPRPLFPMSDLSQINREVVFLVCNVILLFLIKDSGLIRFFRSSDDVDDHCHDGHVPIGCLMEEEEVEAPDESSRGEDGREAIAVVQDDCHEEEEVEEEELMEINKVFDDFIERFKREMRLESQNLALAGNV